MLKYALHFFASIGRNVSENFSVSLYGNCLYYLNPFSKETCFCISE